MFQALFLGLLVSRSPQLDSEHFGMRLVSGDDEIIGRGHGYDKRSPNLPLGEKETLLPRAVVYRRFFMTDLEARNFVQ